ncbi:MAG TPA: hypothetical protein VF092_24490 [Longimicrobium sp.]
MNAADEHDTSPAALEQARVTQEIWRGRGAIARMEAAALREQVRVALWVARRQVAYRAWLLAEARRELHLLQHGGGGADRMPSPRRPRRRLTPHERRADIAPYSTRTPPRLRH